MAAMITMMEKTRRTSEYVYLVASKRVTQMDWEAEDSTTSFFCAAVEQGAGGKGGRAEAEEAQ